LPQKRQCVQPSSAIADGDFRNENLMQLLMQLKDGAQGWHGRGASSRYPRARTRELTVLHRHGDPPDGRVAKTLYDLLDASPDDDAERLKAAFHKAVRANHPDLHPNDPDATVRLSGIVRAYAILRDAHERASYDRALDLERESPGSEPKRTFFNAMRRIFTEAGTVAALAVTLSAGYALLANVLLQFSEDRKLEEVLEPATIPTVELAGQGGLPMSSGLATRTARSSSVICTAHEGTSFDGRCYERIPSSARVRRAAAQSGRHAHAAVFHIPRRRALWPSFQWRWPSFRWGH
jgi:curved DNA-binding protein CbpA